MQIEEKKSLLKTIDLLSFFHETTLERLAEESREISLDPDQVLFNEGEKGQAMYIVLSGEILIFKKNTNITLLGPGSFFGELALIEGQPRTASAKAISSSLLMEINEERFQGYFASQPQVLMAIMKTMSSRFRDVSRPADEKRINYDNDGKPVFDPGQALEGHTGEAILFEPESLKIHEISHQAQLELGLNSADTIKGTLLDLAPGLDTNALQTLVAPLLNKTRPLTVFETNLKRSDGSIFPAEIRLVVIDRPSLKNGVLLRFRNITDRKHMEDAIRQMAYYDSLTGLPNRNLLNDRLAVALARAKRNEERICIMFLDLDHFKSVNDTLGHDAGDHLLREVAFRLKNTLRSEDTIARLGGDEFIILAPGIRSSHDTSILAEKILRQFQKPVLLQEHEMFIGCSIGISIFPEDGEDVKELMKNADLALYRAKDQGRNNFQMYTPALNTRAMERMAIEKNMRKAFKENEFSQVFQPRIDLTSGEIVGMETLTRWYSPELGHVSPMEFIPVAEETRQIVELGHWTLIEACRQLRIWHNAGFDHLSMAVNLSPIQFSHPSLFQEIESALKETSIPPEKLELEITESILMKDTDQVLGILKQICDIGIRVAIDDFGTGYSSLNYLKNLPIHFLKIDQTFISDLSKTANSAITKTIVALGQSLNLRTIAEGVETEAQLEFLKTIECHEAQGYLFSRPLPADQMSALLEKNKIFF